MNETIIIYVITFFFLNTDSEFKNKKSYVSQANVFKVWDMGILGHIRSRPTRLSIYLTWLSELMIST